MGYTHYFPATRDLTAAEFAKIGEACRQIIKAAPADVRVVREFDQLDESPEITGDFVAFNGPGEAGHETFWLPRIKDGFQFCKTAYKPYDVIVVACLIATDDIAPDALEISSDGGRADWEAGLKLAQQALGRPLVIPDGVTG